MAPRKVDMGLKVKAMASQVAELLDDLDALASIYTSSGYQQGGSDPITDNDLTGHAITVAQIGQFGTFVTNLLKLVSNQAATQGQYRQQLDAMRNIP